MNLLQRSVRWLADATGSVPRDPMDPRFWGSSSSAQTSAGEWVGADQAFQLDVVQSVLGRLSGTVSTLPLMVYERLQDPVDDSVGDADADDAKTQGEGRQPARSHSLFRLLHRQPNRRQTAQEFRAEQVVHLAFWRNAFAEIVPGDEGAVGSLEPIHPSRLKTISRGDGGRVTYTFAGLDGAGDLTLRDDEVWHIRMAPLTADGLRGQFMWETSRETFGRAIAVERFGALYFKNGGSGGGILEHPGTFKSKEERDNFLEAWRSSGGGSMRHSDRLLLNGVKYTKQTVANDESQFLETLKEVSVKLCRLWNMPPHMVGILDRATFSNIEQQSTEYVVYTLAPYLAAIEQSACRDLLIGDDQDRYFVEHNVQGLLRGDWRTRWAGYAQGRQWGWLSVNDIRRLENLPPIGSGGDVYLQPSNMIPANAEPAPDVQDTPNQPGEEPPDA